MTNVIEFVLAVVLMGLTVFKKSYFPDTAEIHQLVAKATMHLLYIFAELEFNQEKVNPAYGRSRGLPVSG